MCWGQTSQTTHLIRKHLRIEERQYNADLFKFCVAFICYVFLLVSMKYTSRTFPLLHNNLKNMILVWLWRWVGMHVLCIRKLFICERRKIYSTVIFSLAYQSDIFRNFNTFWAVSAVADAAMRITMTCRIPVLPSTFQPLQPLILIWYDLTNWSRHISADIRGQVASHPKNYILLNFNLQLSFSTIQLAIIIPHTHINTTSWWFFSTM